MGRRRFDQLWTELSVALGERLPRYPLWLHVCEAGWNPEQLEREEVLAYCRDALPGFLRARSLPLGRRAQRRLLAAVARFEAGRPTPEEWFQRLASTPNDSR